MLFFGRKYGVSPAVSVVLALCLIPLAHAQFSVPPNDGYFTDAAGIVSTADERRIEEELLAYTQLTSNEIAVVTLKTLDGYPIEQAALEIARKWGIGSSKNNGLLMLVAYEDREIRIEVGYGLEGVVPDLVAKGVIDMDMTPLFRDGQYAEGIESGITSLKKHIGNEYTAERYSAHPGITLNPNAIFFFLIVFQWLLAVLGRTKSWWLGGVLGAIGGAVLAFLYGWWFAIFILAPIGWFLDYIVSKNYHRRGPTSWWAGGGWGPGSGSHGGGFGGFGGGGFGGGGASGRW
jgi:uncharacterized protein